MTGQGVVGIQSESAKHLTLTEVLSDFDLRPPWALAVALREAVREEMRRAWHDDSAFLQNAPCEVFCSEQTRQKPEDPASKEMELLCQRKFVPGQASMVSRLLHILLFSVDYSA